MQIIRVRSAAGIGRRDVAEEGLEESKDEENGQEDILNCAGRGSAYTPRM